MTYGNFKDLTRRKTFDKKICDEALAKSVLIPLGLTAASATDAAIHKKIFGSVCPSDLVSRMTTLIVFTEEMNDIMSIVKSLEESGLLI